MTSGTGITATADIADVGTIDVYHSKMPTPAIRLTVNTAAANTQWTATVAAGPVTIKADEPDLRKLTLSFMASVSTHQPITVQIESLDGQGKVTGSASGEVYPAAPDYFQRYALEVSSLKPDGKNPFDPGSRQVRFIFGLKSEAGLPQAQTRELRIDNIEFASPSFYVSPTGNDAADGKTEATALAKPQTAIEKAGPGDIILLKGGQYTETEDVIRFIRPGTPAGWITVKNTPGETPMLKSTGWHTIRIGLGSKEAPSTGPGIAYVEVRGLHVVGTSSLDETGKPVTPYPELLGKPVAATNTNGVLIEGRSSKQTVHHIRLADCVVTRNAGGGIIACYADWLQFENNITSDNSWFTVYATSGISILLGSDFDGTTGGYRFLISGNRSFGNRCYQKWTSSSIDVAPRQLSDGNGIIIDTLGGNALLKKEPHAPFTGRALVVNNISCNNGGSGIHLFLSPNVDLVNNTTYLNGQTPELKYSQLYGYGSSGTNFVNNILVAPAGQNYNVSGGHGEAGNAQTIWSHNLFFGSDIAPRPGGTDEIMADPKFRHPSSDARTADFSLRVGSPATAAGTRAVPNVPIPLIDIDGHHRPLDKNPSMGALQ
jgi:hypothetical protein